MVIPQDVCLRTLKGIVELIKKRLPLLTAGRLAPCRARGVIQSTGPLRLSSGEPPKRRDSTLGSGWRAGVDTLISSRLGDRFVDIAAQFHEEGLKLDVSAHH